MKLIQILLLGILIINELVLAQSQFIDFYGTRISIGMSKTEVQNLFRKNYEIEQKDNFIVVYTKDDKSYVGDFGFENNRLYVANRFWGVYETENPMEFTDVLYTLFSKIEGENLGTAEISTYTQNEPTATYKTLTYDYGDKDILIQIVNTKKYYGVTITERLLRVNY